MIQIAESAAKHIKRIQEEEARTGEFFLRVKVVGGGCSGMSYKLDFDTNIKSDDKVFENHGVKVVTDPKSYLHLIGTQLEFEGGLNGKGFIFNNPNAKKSCGCGSSFAV
jgi:iron-sulfur cluster assembly protein